MLPMTDPIRLRHVITGQVVEKSTAEFAAMALTPLGKVYDIVDNDGPSEDLEEVFEVDVDEDDDEEYDSVFYTQEEDK